MCCFMLSDTDTGAGVKSSCFIYAVYFLKYSFTTDLYFFIDGFFNSLK